MIATHIRLKNWRNFVVADVSLNPRTFVVGANASGKSNFLDVFRFLRDIAKREGGGLQQAVTARGGLSKMRCLMARKDPTVEIDLEIGDSASATGQPKWRYRLGIGQEPRGFRRPIVASEQVWNDGKVVLQRPDKLDNTDAERLTQTHLEQIGSNNLFRDVASYLESVQYLHLVPQIIKNPEYFTGKVIPLDPYGQTFLERVARTRDSRREKRLSRIQTALRNVVPNFEELKLVKDEIGVPHLEMNYRHWRQFGAKQNEDQFSDGTLRLIGLFWMLLESESLLLLEEPEMSLNSGIIKRLPSLISRMQRQTNRQVILSTHSGEMLQDRGIGLEEVILLNPNENGTTVHSAASIREVLDLVNAGMSVADAVIPRVTPSSVNQLNLELK